MNRKWWKAIFFFALALMVLDVVPLFWNDEKKVASWQWWSILFSTVQIMGLFGFAFWRRIAIPPFWQVMFVASVIYEIFDLYSMAADSDFSSSPVLLFFNVAITLMLQMPLLVGLFLYGLRSKELWHGKT